MDSEGRTSPAKPTASDILEGLQGRLEPVAVRPLYRVASVFIAVAMMLLPLVYVALVVLVGWTVLSFAITQSDLLTTRPGAAGARVFAYCAPLVVGGIWLLFMVKPLFALGTERARARRLDPEREELLFAFVDSLCAVLGSPRPTQIDVHLSVNASAGLRRGFRSLFSSDLKLTIGLPMAAGLTLRQFTGILAHEFGHFAQGGGMRMQYIVRAVSFWFQRVVYERDEWDVGLEELSMTRMHWSIQILLNAARGCVWLTRRILWMLMIVGETISSFMSRQMEYDADRFEARLAGSETFAETALRIRVLGFAHSKAERAMERARAEKKVCDNLPELIAAIARELPPDVVRQIEAEMNRSRVSFFDTHPADASRIANARAEKAPGLFLVDGPASALFADFDGLCSECTREYLDKVLERDARSAKVVAAVSLAREELVHQRAAGAFERYFQGLVVPTLPLLPDAIQEPPLDVASALGELRECRRVIERHGPMRVDRAREHASQYAILLNVRRFREVSEMGFEVKPAQFGLALKDVGGLGELERETRQSLRAIEGELHDLRNACKRRLDIALSLLKTPQVASTLANLDASAAEAARMSEVLVGLAPALDRIAEAQEECAALEALLVGFRSDEQNALIARMLEVARPHQEWLAALHARVEGVVYPFEHAMESVSVAAYLADSVPDARLIGKLAATSRGMLHKLIELYLRAASRLVVIAEDIERAHGLQPLAAPAAMERAVKAA